MLDTFAYIFNTQQHVLSNFSDKQTLLVNGIIQVSSYILKMCYCDDVFTSLGDLLTKISIKDFSINNLICIKNA